MYFNTPQELLQHLHPNTPIEQTSSFVFKAGSTTIDTNTLSFPLQLSPEDLSVLFPGGVASNINPLNPAGPAHDPRPGFEDEYQLRGQFGGPIPNLSGFPTDGYGEGDRLPLGSRNPLGHSRGAGGMFMPSPGNNGGPSHFRHDDPFPFK